MPTPKEIAQNLIDKSNSKNYQRIGVNKMLAESAMNALEKQFEESGDRVGHITSSALVEVALLQMLDPDERKQIMVQLPDTKWYNTLRKLAFETSTISAKDTADQIKYMGELVQRIDRSRKISDRTLDTITNSVAMLLRYATGDKNADFDSELADSKFSEIMDHMYSRSNGTLVNDLQRQTINIQNRNKKDANK